MKHRNVNIVNKANLMHNLFLLYLSISICFRRHVEIDKYTKSKLCIKLALFTRLYRDAGQQNIQNRITSSNAAVWAGHVACMGEDRGVHRVLVGKPEGKRSLGRPRRRWEDKIKMDLQEVGGGHGDWMELAQDRDRWRALVGTVRDFRVP